MAARSSAEASVLRQGAPLPAANVTVIKNYMGGGFGSKLSLGDYTVAAANLARQAGRPVKMLNSRRDNAVCVGYRPSSHQTYKVGAKKDGTIVAFSLLNYASGGIAAGDDVAEPVVDIYKCPNCKVEEHTVFTNVGAQRAMRAPGHTQGAFGLESVMDELAAALDMDPLELRRKNYSARNLGDTGLPYSSKGLDQCYDLGAKAIGWERRNRRPGEGSASGPLRRGIGAASSIWFGAGSPGTLADVVLYPDGSVEVVCGTQDIGCGTRTHMAVVAAETLGLGPKDITVKLGNSDYPWAPISGGSLTTPSVAPAVRDAALKAVERLKAVAAARLKVEAGDIVMADRKFASKSDPAKSASFAEVCRDLRRETVFHGERGGMPGDQYAFNTFGAHFAEVGSTLRPGRSISQIVAAQTADRSSTSSPPIAGHRRRPRAERRLRRAGLDDATGTRSIRTCAITRSRQRSTSPRSSPSSSASSTRGSTISAEEATAGRASSPAIANALYNAIGVHVREIPMTPQRVLAALKRKEAGS
jgi:xanthine dehydrogenase YagR molybdenum-binding subunit